MYIYNKYIFIYSMEYEYVYTLYIYRDKRRADTGDDVQRTVLVAMTS